ncbi:SH3 domain-containing protein, partial [Lentibacillus sp.]|uniref:SH3 domain-containing protein n=1 Tax=Lentibacillus sp. TaxID=1925746 RepID=UPI002B4B0125
MGKLRLFMTATTFILLFAALAPTVQADDGRTYKVGTNVLNVRSAPSHSANVVGHLMSGDQAVVFQEKHGWAQTYYDGQVAWVAAHYLYPAENNTAV